MVSLQAALAAMIISGSGPTVLLDFYGDTCPPCRAMAPTIEELSAKYPIRKINVATEPEMAAQYGVTQIPCFIMLRNGEEVDRAVGGTTFSRIERMCKLGQGLIRKGQSPLDDYLLPPNQAPPAHMAAPAQPPGRSPAALPRQVGAVDPPHREPWPAASPQAIPALQTTLATPPSPTATASDWRLSQPGWTPRGNARAARDAGMISATVRLRIEDPRGHSFGSGTIIDTRGGQALVLTCGHIFRDLQGNGKIEIDLFGPDSSERVPGRLISYDEKADVGLVAFDTPGPVKTARVAPPKYRIAPGDSVVSVGCNNGDRPSTRHTRITALDRCLGPPNLQIAGRSVEGRSGGGLFSADGMVIGVCNAAYQNEDESLYAAVGAVHAELDKVGLSCVYRPADAITPLPATRASDPEMVAIAPPAMPREMPLPTAAAATAPSRLGAAEQAAMDRIAGHLQQGDELICIVRPGQGSQGRARLVVLDQLSPELAEQLVSSPRGHETGELLPTRLGVPRKTPSPQPFVRQSSWSAQSDAAIGVWRTSQADSGTRRR
ncbi:MAG: trypsin-like peptidase domain-containing protein [Candidatus Nealsonbacteria bacterium]|nr:trypsin-like peptidase domain-containing protein [Candidatus Nealsonbacteria bacterium]